jgi:hypothetical protein
LSNLGVHCTSKLTGSHDLPGSDDAHHRTKGARNHPCGLEHRLGPLLVGGFDSFSSSPQSFFLCRPSCYYHVAATKARPLTPTAFDRPPPRGDLRVHAADLRGSPCMPLRVVCDAHLEVASLILSCSVLSCHRSIDVRDLNTKMALCQHVGDKNRASMR